VSEVARIRQQIEHEYQVMRQGLLGIAQMARHDFISKRMEALVYLEEELAMYVGDEVAMATVVTIHNRYIDGCMEGADGSQDWTG
jgi:hypothetical protein